MRLALYLASSCCSRAAWSAVSGGAGTGSGDMGTTAAGAETWAGGRTAGGPEIFGAADAPVIAGAAASFGLVTGTAGRFWSKAARAAACAALSPAEETGAELIAAGRTGGGLEGAETAGGWGRITGGGACMLVAGEPGCCSACSSAARAAACAGLSSAWTGTVSAQKSAAHSAQNSVGARIVLTFYYAK